MVIYLLHASLWEQIMYVSKTKTNTEGKAINLTLRYTDDYCQLIIQTLLNKFHGD